MAILYLDFIKFKQTYQKLLDDGIEPTIKSIKGQLHKSFKDEEIIEALVKIEKFKERQKTQELVTVETVLETFKKMHAEGKYQSVPSLRAEMGIKHGFSNELHRCLLQIKEEYPEYIVLRSKVRILVRDTYNEMVAAGKSITISSFNDELVLKGHSLHKAVISKHLIEIRGVTQPRGKAVIFTPTMILQAIKQLESEGIKPTPPKIREQMGGGTYYFIRDLLNEYESNNDIKIVTDK